MIFASIKGITIPEGAVKQIADSDGRVLWKGGLDVAGMAIGYTGAYTDQLEVTMSGKKYRLLTLTGSGTLTVDAEVNADVWLCNGGNSGIGAGYEGGGGGYFLRLDKVALQKSTACIIGAGGHATNYTSGTAKGGGTTSFGEETPDTQPNGSNCKNGASGGGAGGGSAGSGCGQSTVPFEEASVFGVHSAGGGGGANEDREINDKYGGGTGGSNGANGGTRVGASNVGGTGGEKGGGKGGNSTSDGDDATFYGSGGGGGGYYCNRNGNETRSYPGDGYQGVIYVRIPYEQ